MKTTIFAMGFAIIIGIGAWAIRVPAPEIPQPRPKPQQPRRHYVSPSPASRRARRYARRWLKQPTLPFEATSFVALPDVSTALSLGKYREVQRMARTVTENLGVCPSCCSPPSCTSISSVYVEVTGLLGCMPWLPEEFGLVGASPAWVRSFNITEETGGAEPDKPCYILDCGFAVECRVNDGVLEIKATCIIHHVAALGPHIEYASDWTAVTEQPLDITLGLAVSAFDPGEEPDVSLCGECAGATISLHITE